MYVSYHAQAEATTVNVVTPVAAKRDNGTTRIASLEPSSAILMEKAQFLGQLGFVSTANRNLQRLVANLKKI